MIGYAEGLRKVAAGEGWQGWLDRIGEQLRKDYSWSDNGTENLIRWGGTGLAGLAGWMLPGRRASRIKRLLSALAFAAVGNRGANYYLESLAEKPKAAAPAAKPAAKEPDRDYVPGSGKPVDTPAEITSSYVPGSGNQIADPNAPRITSSYVPGSGNQIDDPSGFVPPAETADDGSASVATATGAGIAGAGYGAYAGYRNWDTAKARFKKEPYGKLDLSPASKWTPGGRLTRLLVTSGKEGAYPGWQPSYQQMINRERVFNSRLRKGLNTGAHAIGYGLPMAVAGWLTPRVIHGFTGGKN